MAFDASVYFLGKGVEARIKTLWKRNLRGAQDKNFLLEILVDLWVAT